MSRRNKNVSSQPFFLLTIFCRTSSEVVSQKHTTGNRKYCEFSLVHTNFYSHKQGFLQIFEPHQTEPDWAQGTAVRFDNRAPHRFYTKLNLIRSWLTKRASEGKLNHCEDNFQKVLPLTNKSCTFRHR